MLGKKTNNQTTNQTNKKTKQTNTHKHCTQRPYRQGKEHTWKSVAGVSCCCPAALSSSPSGAALFSASAPQLHLHSPLPAAWNKYTETQSGWGSVQICSCCLSVPFPTSTKKKNSSFRAVSEVTWCRCNNINFWMMSLNNITLVVNHWIAVTQLCKPAGFMLIKHFLVTQIQMKEQRFMYLCWLTETCPFL